MNEKKKEVTLCGCTIRPITVGKEDIYAAGGYIHRTSRGVVDHEQTEDMVHSETSAAHYHLSMTPSPLAAASPVPVTLATCA